jgi:hypothetical protein
MPKEEEFTRIIRENEALIFKVTSIYMDKQLTISKTCTRRSCINSGSLLTLSRGLPNGVPGSTGWP